MSKLFLCLILLLGLYNCQSYKGAKVYEITRDSNGNNEVDINVSVGEEFALKLKGNPTTGYTWVLLNPEDIDESLEATNFGSDGIAEYVSNSKNKLLDGAGGYFYYTFKAIKVNYEVKPLKFSYRRLWEKETNSEPDALVKITVS